MILSAAEIVRRLRKGQEDITADPLAIVPLPTTVEIEASGAAAVDLRLGCWFMSLRQARLSHLPVDPDDQRVAHHALTKLQYVPFGTEYFLHPGSFVLAATLEWIRLPCDVGAYVVGKSSWGRRGLIIATAAGVHPRFTGCLTLELSNVGEIPIGMKPGMAICQLFMHSVKREDKDLAPKSSFQGYRRPILGRVKQDDLAKILFRAPK
jgi:dCTP deaminase